MSKNYLPVIGGKTIEAIYGNNTFGAAKARIVQYNSKKEKIGDITEIRPKISEGLPTSVDSTPKQLTLNKKTAFIKFCISHWTQGTIIEDTQITIAYVEDAVTDYVDRYVTKIYIDAPTKSEFEDNCNQLDERIDYIEGLLNQTVSYVDSTNGYFRYAKRHGMVFVATSTKIFAGDNIVKMAVWTEVDSIPQECAPHTDIYFNATLTSSANRLGIVRISWDGKIYLYSPSADCDACWGYFTYPAKGTIN